MHKLFPSQLEEEHIYLVVREHWFRLFLKLLAWSVLAITLVLFRLYATPNFPSLFEGRAGNITNLFIQMYLLVLILGYFLIFIFYYLSIEIITSIRIVEVIQEGLFSHTISELHIDKIEDATSQTTGIFGTIFNYGDVFVQTAGTVDRFEFHKVPNPALIEKLVLDLYEKNSNFARDTDNKS